MTQVPAPVRLTVAPKIEQAPEVEEESMVNVTGIPTPRRLRSPACRG